MIYTEVNKNMYTYVVERNEGTEWIPLMQCNFEDTKHFYEIAKNSFYRILKDGEDVTDQYRNINQSKGTKSSSFQSAPPKTRQETKPVSSITNSTKSSSHTNTSTKSPSTGFKRKGLLNRR